MRDARAAKDEIEKDLKSGQKLMNNYNQKQKAQNDIMKNYLIDFEKKNRNLDKNFIPFIDAINKRQLFRPDDFINMELTNFTDLPNDLQFPEDLRRIEMSKLLQAIHDLAI